MCLRGKFRAMIHISNETRSTKYPKIGHIRLVTSDKLMRSFLQELMKVNLVDDMAGSVDCFGPEPNWGLVFSKHCSGHLNKGTILPFNNTILLRCVSSREFMSEAIIIKKFFDVSIFEFSPIVTTDMLQLRIIFNLSSLSERCEDVINFALIIQEENPSIT